ADSLQIEDLRFRNCPIEIARDIPGAGVDGVIGARVFEKFLIRFDPRGRILELTPLGEDNARAPRPASTPVKQLRHLLLIKAVFNGAGSGYFLLDTGAAFSSVSLGMAPPVRTAPRSVAVDGFSGHIAGATRVTPMQFHFTHEPILDDDVIALDLGGISA